MYASGEKKAEQIWELIRKQGKRHMLGQISMPALNTLDKQKQSN